MKVFVYGTLKKGFYNHTVMERATGSLLGPATTVEEYSMFSLGAYPAVCKDFRTSPIYGEVYEVQDVRPLDMLEGYPNFYTREIVKVQLDTEIQEAWMYFLNPMTNARPRDEKLIRDGVWR